MTQLSGLPIVRAAAVFHDMRHSFATMLLVRGVDAAVVSKALGHANLATTVDIYGHWCRPMQERTAAVMESVLAPTGSQVAYRDAERPPEIEREGVFALMSVVGATGFEPATS
jgi:hypothetical protein